jgi:hypothetical protein
MTTFCMEGLFNFIFYFNKDILVTLHLKKTSF